MNTAEKLKKEIIEKAKNNGIFRGEAISLALRNENFLDYYVKDGRSKFIFKDKSVLIINRNL